MKLQRTVVIAALLVSTAAFAQQEPAWQKKIHAQHDRLIAINGGGTDLKLRDELLAMRAEDQRARGLLNGQPANKEKLEFASNLADIDRGLTERLKSIVAAHGWPTIQEVGIDASNGALLILTHSADHAWKRSLLPELEKMAAADKIDGSQLALTVDEELVAEGKPQRYGCRFKFVDGKAMMFAVEDPGHMDERRAKAMLPPMDVYKKMLGEMYHIEVSDMIVRPDAPAR